MVSASRSSSVHSIISSLVCSALEPVLSNETSNDEQIQILNAIELNMNPMLATLNNKRATDENDESHLPKRFCSSSIQSGPTMASSTEWIPPTPEQVTRVQAQSSSVFQFILSLAHGIVTASDNQLTDEQVHWLRVTIDLYDHDYNNDKLNSLMEIACKVARTNLVR